MSKKVELPKGLSVTKLNKYYEEAKSAYAPSFKKMRTLIKADRCNIWKALDIKFPKYQILPDTNFIRYVKNNLVASIYTVTKSASILPTSDDDKDVITNLNLVLDNIWEKSEVGYKQFQAGTSAALTNIGITQVGWSEELISDEEDFNKGHIVVRNINPLKFMRDPSAISLETSAYCMTYENYHKSIFKATDKYKEQFDLYLETKQAAQALNIPEPDSERKQASGSSDYYTLVTFWVRLDDKMYEVHTVNAEWVLYCTDIVPAMFPFALLYCNDPEDDLVGVSEPQAIFANNVAYNLLNSIALTSEYRNQKPPKFINKQSGLNINAFAKHGDEAGHTFVVANDASRAVHYQQYPQISAVLPSIRDSLQLGIQTVSGVDGRYTGKDTGSIITTGGVEEMLNRATLIDTPKIMCYEHYTKRLTKLILANLIEFGSKRKYFIKKPNDQNYSEIEVDFPKLDAATVYSYTINISSELPKTKQSIAALATNLMEKQMQYGSQGQKVDLITPEEWLMFQDLPFKEFMLSRMNVSRLNDSVEDVSQTLFQYANLVAGGASPDEALLATAETKDRQRKGEVIEPQPYNMDNVPDGAVENNVNPENFTTI